MIIACQHSQPVKTTPQQAFALIDDLPRTAQWLPPCASLEKLGAGPNAKGDALRYVYKEGGRTREMSGVILERVPGERLYTQYDDPMFQVVVDLRVRSDPLGALTEHHIQITPKTLIGKLMSPLIKLGLKKQTRDAAANLKRLLEAEG